MNTLTRNIFDFRSEIINEKSSICFVAGFVLICIMQSLIQSDFRILKITQSKEKSVTPFTDLDLIMVHIRRVNSEEHDSKVKTVRGRVQSTYLSRTVQKVCTEIFKVYLVWNYFVHHVLTWYIIFQNNKRGIQVLQ